MQRRYLQLIFVALLLAPAAAAAGSSQAPVVLIHGFDGGPEDFRGTELVLEARGFDPLLLDWQPVAAEGVLQVAHGVIEPAIEALLEEAGYGPDSSFHLVGHSLGGLLARVLLEQPRPGATLAPRVLSLVMLSTPNQGARTGIARAACHTYHHAIWRPLACDMVVGSALLDELGGSRPEGVQAPYLSIGVEANGLYFPARPYDGDGDGHRSSHDNAVMAEAAYLGGAPFVLWRGRTQSNHFRGPCSSVVNGWIADFMSDGTVPVAEARRVPSGNSCHGLSKKDWLHAREVEAGRGNP